MENKNLEINGVVLTPDAMDLLEELQQDNNHEILKLNKSITDIIMDLYMLENYLSSPKDFNEALNKTEIVKKLHHINWHFSQFMKPHKI